MTTQTATTEREPRGHYEIDTGNGWQHIDADEVKIIFRYYAIKPLWVDELRQQGRRICIGIATYRYVEDGPAPEREEMTE